MRLTWLENNGFFLLEMISLAYCLFIFIIFDEKKSLAIIIN